jgi:hypothetical protein
MSYLNPSFHLPVTGESCAASASSVIQHCSRPAAPLAENLSKGASRWSAEMHRLATQLPFASLVHERRRRVRHLDACNLLRAHE